MRTLRIMLFSLFLAATGLYAQTGISGAVSGASMATHYRGQWYVTALNRNQFDFKDSTPDMNGYVDSIYLTNENLLGSASAGFSYYGGGFDLVPAKTLAALIKSTNIPADSFRIYVGGSAGELVPSTGPGYLTGTVHAGLSVALNKNGTITWQTVEASWMNPGIVTVDSGIVAYFGVNPQSSVQAKVRKFRMLMKRGK